MPRWTFADLDQRPELASSTLPLFAAVPGSQHVVCGFPHRMGQTPTIEDLRACLGVVVLLDRMRPVAAVAICPYSQHQATLWGPALGRGDHIEAARELMVPVRAALTAGGYESMRVLVDTRNRTARSLILQLGFTTWKDNLLFERQIDGQSDRYPVLPETPPIAGVRRAMAADFEQVTAILDEGFPESDHCRGQLATREKEGYRHYLLMDPDVKTGPGLTPIVAAAAVQQCGQRVWLKLIAVAQRARGRRLGERLLWGILQAEAQRGARGIGLDVLADNRPAIALYERCGFLRQWAATICTGPV